MSGVRTRSGSRGQVDSSTWPDIDAGTLDATALRSYLRRKKAITAYLAGVGDAELRKEFGFSRHSVAEIIRTRCLHPHPDGDVYGWRGAVRYAHIALSHRTAPVKVDTYGKGAAGALRLLLELEPDLARRFERQVLKTSKPDELAERRKPRRVHWNWFLSELRKLGYESRNQWPFTVKSMGYWSVARHVDQILAGSPARAALLAGGPDARKKLLSGDGVNRPQLRLLQRVEMDAHKLDCRVCIMMPHLDGGWTPRLVHRLWVIVIVEVVTRAVLGYFLSLHREVTKEDVLHTIKRALSRWRMPALQFSAGALIPGAGLPSSRSDSYVGLCWDETHVDGALAETCATVKEALAAVVSSSLSDPSSGFSARRSKDDRPYIERFFDTLSGRGVGRLTTSTGASPQERRGREPEKIATLRQFQLPYLEELLAVLIANYNATQHSGLGYRTPLDQLDFLVNQQGMPRRADATLVQALLSVRKQCPVRGGYREGRRPFVNFMGARYTNEILGDRHDLVGKSIWVVNHIEDDARVAQAWTTEGLKLGVLRAGPPWHRLPHSLAVRRSINAMVYQRLFTVSSGADAVSALIEYCESQTGKKLPVHPTYLDVQRIFAEHMHRQDPAADLAHSRARLAERAEVEKGSAVGLGSVSHVGAAAAPASELKTTRAAPATAAPADGIQGTAAAAPAAKAKKALPVLRMAANK